MTPNNIKEFRAGLSDALKAHGLSRRKLRPQVQPGWEVFSEGAIKPQYFPHEIRHPWGFNLTGVITIEVLEFRSWLDANYPAADQGIFRSTFVGWHLGNDRDFDFLAATGEHVPIGEWVERVKVRLERIPTSLDELVRAYRLQSETIRGLASVSNRPAWDFLLDWLPKRHTSMPIPWPPGLVR